MNKNNLFYFVIGIAFLGLFGAGLLVIIKSNEIYDHSRTIYNQTYELAKQRQTVPYPVTSPNYTVIKEGYAQALLYFTLALGALVIALLLPRLQNVSISPTGGINLTLRDIQQNLGNIRQRVTDITEQTNTIQAASVGAGGIKAQRSEQNIQTRSATRTSEQKKDADDPQKGKWGGLAERNERQMHATVEESGMAGYYIVKLRVESTNAANPLRGLVKFHLHNSFNNPDPVIAVKDGRAVLQLKKVYGAFTVGAEADDGETRLELDLALLPDAPPDFKAR